MNADRSSHLHVVRGDLRGGVALLSLRTSDFGKFRYNFSAEIDIALEEAP